MNLLCEALEVSLSGYYAWRKPPMSQQYVASNTLEEPLAWSNSTLLTNDASEAVARLKQELDKELMVMGSGELIRSLRRRNLVDKYVLMIHPLILGSGRRLFTEGSPFTTLRLVAASTTEKGIVVATYEPMESKTASTATH
ncbi:MAG: dihydrofolate reductase family protein [Ktedonobacteraceae bacterium]